MSRYAWKALLCVALAAVCGGAVSAQNTGIRFIFPHLNSIVHSYGFARDLGIGVGLDRSTAGGLTFGLDWIGSGPSTAFDDYLEVKTVSRNSRYATYNMSMSTWTLRYRVSYHLNGESSGFYLGSFFGVRKVELTGELKSVVEDSQYWGLPRPNYPEYVSAETMVYPLGLRMGLSHEPDGWYNDFYLELGTQLGGRAMELGQGLFRKGVLDVRAVTVSLGLSCGIGW